jgi:predicted ATPase/DNA-binding winged helix-turn-helix (wHTH) protein
MADDFARVATVIEATGEEGPFPIIVPRLDPLSNTAKGEFRFGPFRLLVKERRLERDRQIVPLGSRALDILAALVGRAGEVVNKRELTEAAWPGLIVEEGSLRFHVASLRRALGERAEGQPYLTTVAGRGYCFTAELSHDPMPTSPSGGLAKDVGFPANLRRSFGMDVAAAAAAAELMEWRFLTLVGPPGIGKTRLAIQLGHQLAERFSDGAVFIDFGSVSGPHLVPNAIAAAIGRLLPPDQALDGLLALLRGKQMLIVLDGCEHIIDAVAEFAERLFGQAPTITILATSRESLRVDGERVYRLFPLACPSETQGLTAEEALKFPAVQLFVDRTRAGQAGFAVSDEEAPFVSEICRKLDGIPLALELAAGRVPSYGIKQTASLLDGRFRLLWQGRRTAPPRHQTLSAALDWSYDLLSFSERQVLRRVSVFAGLFTLDAARAVAADGVTPAETVVAVLADLVAKSLVVREEGTSDARYRLLDTTRVYGLAKLLATEEAATIVRRHAIHLRDLLVIETRSDVLARPKANPYDDRIGNVRTALQWSFSTGQDDALAVSLAAVAGPLFLELSLADECLEWTKRGLSALSPADLGGMIEAKLRAAYGLALLALGGCGEEIERAFRRGHDIARKAGDSYQTFRFLGGLHVLQIRLGNITAALAVAEQARDAAGLVADPAALSMADAMLAVSHHFGGNHIAARGHKVAALSQPSASARVTNMRHRSPEPHQGHAGARSLAPGRSRRRLCGCEGRDRGNRPPRQPVGACPITRLQRHDLFLARRCRRCPGACGAHRRSCRQASSATLYADRLGHAGDIGNPSRSTGTGAAQDCRGARTPSRIAFRSTHLLVPGRARGGRGENGAQRGSAGSYRRGAGPRRARRQSLRPAGAASSQGRDSRFLPTESRPGGRLLARGRGLCAKAGGAGLGVTRFAELCPRVRPSAVLDRCRFPTARKPGLSLHHGG